jgi:hypothetical protein
MMRMFMIWLIEYLLWFDRLMKKWWWDIMILVKRFLRSDENGWWEYFTILLNRIFYDLITWWKIGVEKFMILIMKIFMFFGYSIFLWIDDTDFDDENVYDLITWWKMMMRNLWFYLTIYLWFNWSMKIVMRIFKNLINRIFYDLIDQWK